MKFRLKAAGLTIFGIAYALSALAVFRHHAAAEDPRRVTIRIAQWQLESGVREALNAIIRRYEAINPRVHVVQIAVPGGPIYVSWVLTQMAGGTAPDLVEYTFSAPDVGRNFQPLTAEVLQPNPYNKGTPLEGVPWRDTIVDDMVGLDCYNPKLNGYYGIPLNTNASRIIFNKPLLKEITGSDAPPATYRDLVRICDQVRAYAAARHLNMAPIANSHDTYEFLSWMIMMAMTNPLSEQIDFQHRLKIEPNDLGTSYLRCEWSYDSPALVAALEELREYGLMCSPGFWQRERDTAVTDFVTARTAMIVAPSWEATNLLSLCPFPIGAFQFPYPREDDPVFGRFAKGPFSDGQLQAGLPIYLSRSTRHRAEAVDFLRFMSSQEGSTIFTQVSNWPPATVGVKPSSFASNFKFNSEGYTWYGNFLLPTEDADTQEFIQTRTAALWGPGSSVELFRKVLRDGVGDSIRSDFRHDIASGLDNLRQQDTVAAAQYELAPGAVPEALGLVTPRLETRIYQDRAVLGESAASPGADSGEIGVPAPPPASAGAGRPPLTPELAAGWRALADYHADQAVLIFSRSLASPDPAVARAARFGRAVALLDRQPVNAAQIEESRGVMASLADSGDDDTSLGARFFLGRIAQHHALVPSNAEAIAQFRRLVAAHGDSAWAQTALPRLALLEIYAADPAEAPAARIARAQTLLPLARNPGSRCAIELAIANATFFYRLPAGGVLAHLLAAESSGRVDRMERMEVLVQIAELSRLAGDTAQAARYYRTFLKENPVDCRCYMVRQRLAALEKGA